MTLSFSTKWPKRMGKLAGMPKIRIGDMSIISEIIKKGRGYKYIIVKCNVCGTKRETMLSSLKRGLGVKCGQACSQALNDGSNVFRRLSMVYHGIIDRTGNPNSEAYKYYGGRGIKNEFASLAVFYKLMKDSYIDAISTKDKPIDLDRINNDKGYSIENCQWISHADNMRKITKRKSQRKFRAISPNGDIYYGENQKLFSKEHNLKTSGVCSGLSGKQESHYGWKFKFINDDIKL